jgi:transaldolase/glucose-6-phosphate isomerase
VSLEVSPLLAKDTANTAKEAKRLWNWVDRPNLMIKIPATVEGLPAVRKTIAEGINANVTLIFSLERYARVLDAYMDGLEDRLAAGKPIDGIASVASFFVSRVDTKVDGLLKAIAGGEKLVGKAAVANARLAYDLFKKVTASKRWQKLAGQGARIQRPLWASTSTKNPAYRDVIYVEELIGADTVNTVPPQTLTAFGEHGKAKVTIDKDVEAAKQHIQKLEAAGISMDRVTSELEVEGVKAFADAFKGMLDTIEERRMGAVKELGPLQAASAEMVKKLETEKVPARIWKKDPSVWTSDTAGQEEIRKRLGWLTAPDKVLKDLPAWQKLRDDLLSEGFTHALILGMGGSSLAPEVLRLTFGAAALDVTILDSTDPAQVRAADKSNPEGKTIYIISSKSGSTAEVAAMVDYFWVKMTKLTGEKAGQYFIAITDPDTSLEKLGKERKFRAVINGDPTVGGRYSALTPFGLVPATLLGLDTAKLVERARALARDCSPDVPAGRNPGLVLGAILGAVALDGRDKLTVIADKGNQSFGAWLEQLVAESSGKQDKGIVPVDGEPHHPVQGYGADRIFIYLRLDGSQDRFVTALQKAGQPVLVFPLRDVYDTGSEFFRWGFATAVACGVMGVNSFDQPDVQFNKTLTLEKIAAYKRSGHLDEPMPDQEFPCLNLYGMPEAALYADADQAVIAFLRKVKPGDYVAINAYLPRNPKMYKALQALRTAVIQHTGAAVTLGFGPRFLHSTGQLHKGGANNGVFLQITADPEKDIEIPNQGMSFGVLERAQALGDFESLKTRKRRILRIHLKGITPDKIFEEKGDD